MWYTQVVPYHVYSTRGLTSGWDIINIITHKTVLHSQLSSWSWQWVVQRDLEVTFFAAKCLTFTHYRSVLRRSSTTKHRDISSFRHLYKMTPSEHWLLGLTHAPPRHYRLFSFTGMRKGERLAATCPLQGWGGLCTGLYWFVLVCTGLYWSVLVFTGLYWSVLVWLHHCCMYYSATLSHSRKWTTSLERRSSYSWHLTIAHYQVCCYGNRHHIDKRTKLIKCHCKSMDLSGLSGFCCWEEVSKIN